jgi:hypothetical protein
LQFEKNPIGTIIFRPEVYCFDTVGLDADKIQKYVKPQGAQEQKIEK